MHLWLAVIAPWWPAPSEKREHSPWRAASKAADPSSPQVHELVCHLSAPVHTQGAAALQRLPPDALQPAQAQPIKHALDMQGKRLLTPHGRRIVQEGAGARLGYQLHRATNLVQSIGHAHMPARR